MIRLTRTSSPAPAPTRLDGKLVYLRPPLPDEWAAWADLRRTSRDHLTPWEPVWPTDALTESIRVGRVMSTLDSATGSVFTAFLPRAVTQAIIDEERSAALAAGLPAPKQEELDAGIDENRRRGVVIRAPIEPTEPGKPHRVTVSVPLLDHAGQPALVLSATGPIPATGCGLDAPLVNTMVTAAAALSRQLGYKPAG